MIAQDAVTIYINDKPITLDKGRYTSADLKTKGAIPNEEALYRVSGHELHELHDAQTIEVHAEEWFVSHVHILTVLINEKPVRLPKGTYTGAALKQRGGVPTGDILYRIHAHERTPIADDESVEVHEHERFVSVPQVGGAS
jgi:hypothetical protein